MSAGNTYTATFAQQTDRPTDHVSHKESTRQQIQGRSNCTYCGVLSWLAALTSCWNIFLSFMGSIPAKIKWEDKYSFIPAGLIMFTRTAHGKNTGIALPWFISSTTRNGQLVRSWSDTRYRMVETERSYTWHENKYQLLTRHSREKRCKQNTHLTAFIHTPPDWWWALSTCSWPVCLTKIILTLHFKRNRITPQNKVQQKILLNHANKDYSSL